MKKLRKKVNYAEKTVEAFCLCGCYCRPYEDKAEERQLALLWNAAEPY